MKKLLIVMILLMVFCRPAQAYEDVGYGFDGEGTYYFANTYSGAFLSVDSDLRLYSGKIDNCPGIAAFVVECVGTNRYCLRVAGTWWCLACTESGLVTLASRPTYFDGSMSDNTELAAIWRVVPDNGNIRLVNVRNGRTLLDDGGVLRTADAHFHNQRNAGSDCWKAVRTYCYGTSEQCTISELTVSENEADETMTKSETLSVYDVFGLERRRMADPEDFFLSSDQPDIVRVSRDKMTAVAPGTANVTVIHRYTGQKMTAHIRVSNNVILIVPGFMGSELKNSDNQYVWSLDLLNSLSENFSLKAAKRFLDLKSPSSGDGIYAGGSRYGYMDLYKDWYLAFTENLGDEWSVEFFAYDWRKSSEDSGQRLAKYITDKHFDNVMLVGHSFGGLVCAQALAYNENVANIVSKAVMVGVPWNGTPGLLGAWKDGFGEALGLGSFGSIADSVVLSIVATLPSIYEMIPSQMAVETLGMVENCSSYSDFLDACEDFSGFDKSMASKANSVMRRLYDEDGNFIMDSVPTVYMGGTGYETTEKATLSGGRLSFVKSENGDGIVPLYACIAGKANQPDMVEHYSERHLYLPEETLFTLSIVNALKSAE